MNARDLQTKASKETKFESPNFPKDPKNKKSLWDKLTDLSLSSTSDRIKFLFVFVLTGLGGILIGDVFKLILMKGTGILYGSKSSFA